MKNKYTQWHDRMHWSCKRDDKAYAEVLVSERFLPFPPALPRMINNFYFCPPIVQVHTMTEIISLALSESVCTNRDDDEDHHHQLTLMTHASCNNNLLASWLQLLLLLSQSCSISFPFFPPAEALKLSHTRRCRSLS